LHFYSARPLPFYFSDKERKFFLFCLLLLTQKRAAAPIPTLGRRGHSPRTPPAHAARGPCINGQVVLFYSSEEISDGFLVNSTFKIETEVYR
jgi:hypothetical protein